MSRFITIKDPNEKLMLSGGWIDLPNFKEKGEIVDRNCKAVGSDFAGRKFQLIAKKERAFSCLEKTGRGLVGLAAVICTLFLAFLFRSVRDLFVKSKETLQVGLLLKPQTKIAKTERMEPIAKAILQDSKSASAPPLPALLTLKLDPNHPLMSPIPLENFFKKAISSYHRPKLAEAIRRSVKEGATMENLLQEFSGVLDTELLNIRLHSWITGNFLNPFEKNLINRPENQEKVTVIQKRIHLLNQTVQLNERLKRIKFSFGICIRDILAAWPNSLLKFDLMMDEELVKLKLTDSMAGVAKHMAQTIGPRIVDLAKGDNETFEPLINDDINELRLTHIPQFRAADFNKRSPFFKIAPFAYCLISPSELPDLDVSCLDRVQLNVIFSNNELVQKLTAQQLEDCIPKVNNDLLSFLSEEQVLSLNFAGNKNIFECIFNELSPRTAVLLPKFSIDRIYKISQHFSAHHWKALSDKQIQDFDFAKLDQNIFNAIFEAYSQRTKTLLQSLSLDKIYQICKYFSEQHWRDLSDTQIQNLDFSIIDQKIFAALFGKYNPRAKELLQGLLPEKIFKIIQFFSKRNWKDLSNKQIRNFNFAKMNKNIFNKIFLANRQRAKTLLQGLQLKKIYEICHHFAEEQWKDLSNKQILNLDFTKIDQKVFDSIFNKYDQRTKTLLSKISDKQLAAAKRFIKPSLKDLLSAHQKQILEEQTIAG